MKVPVSNANLFASGSSNIVAKLGTSQDQCAISATRIKVERLDNEPVALDLCTRAVARDS